MTGDHAEIYAEEVRLLIEKQLRIKGKTLERAIGRAGRLLPKWAQRDGRYLAQATELMAHPKLRLMVDEHKVEKAHRNLITHLETLDPSERRKGFILSVLGSVSFSLIAVLGALVCCLMWRGFL